ncbi:hypothetical protein MMC24_003703 [Lignoscripta atroalba]|nr:hypothetical protein [Lignoscripta atroalba]
MTSTSRIPPLLAPYLSIPSPTSLIFLTSVLGASANWLVLRFLYTALSSNPAVREGHSTELLAEDVKVVFVSFLRDWDYWRDSGRKVGLDLLRLAQKGKLSFVDGLSGLFAPHNGVKTTDTALEGGGRAVLRDARLEGVERVILGAIESVNRQSKDRGKVLLVVDGLDMLLAATDTDAQAMSDMVLELREHVHATVITAAADFALTQSPTTPLEVNHAAFIVSLTHQASFTMSLRLLDTGAARDISGVLRVTRGAGSGQEGEEVEEKELLYLVGGDGGLKVFERRGAAKKRYYHYHNLSADTLIHDEYVYDRNSRVRNAWNDRLTDLSNSEGYLVLWQAPQQDTYAVQTLRLVRALPQKDSPSDDSLNVAKVEAHKQLANAQPSSGRRSLHIQKHTCSSCGYPAAKIRQYNWGEKAKRRKTTGTGRMRTMKEIPRKFKNGFQTGTPKGSRGPSSSS